MATTIEQFKQLTDTAKNLWNLYPSEEFTDEKIRVWHNVLCDLKIHGLIKSLEELAKTHMRLPSISDVVRTYDELRREQQQRQAEKAIADQEAQMHLDGIGQHYCYLCTNTGDVIFRRGNYDYHCRCTCSRGRDLKKWSRPQITKGEPWTNPKNGRHEDIYYPDANDVMTDEEIAVLTAKNRAMIDSGANIGITEIKGVISGMAL